MEMTDQKVAIVTGANKGIGYEIVKGLCKQFDGLVYLTSRDETRGKNALAQLEEQNLKPSYHQLDITDENSIQTFRDFIKEQHGGIDLLINNAAIAFPTKCDVPFAVQAKETLEVNYFSTLRFCNAMFPLLRNNAKVINVSSSAGHLSKIPSETIRKYLSRRDLTEQELTEMMQKFIRYAEEGKCEAEGWGNSTYVVSKVGVSALTFIQQRVFDQETPFRNVSVNSVHPGWVKTDMSNHQGNKSSAEGAEAPLYLALEANFKGKYVWEDCAIVDWYKDEAPLKPRM